MLNRTALFMFRSFVLFGFAVSLAACGHFGHDEAEEIHEEVHEEMEEGASEEAGDASPDRMEMHAKACPHGGGACCEHEEPHPCCEHTMKEEGGAESQPTSQPSE